MAIDVTTYSYAMIGDLVHHLPIGLREPIVRLEEIGVSIDVRHDQLLVDDLVTGQKIGVARVIIDDELVNLCETVGICLGELFIRHSEAPVRVARRKSTIRHNHIHLVVVEHLEDHLEKIEAEVLGIAADIYGEILEFWRQICAHLGLEVLTRGQ